MASVTDRFESTLDDARTSLSRAREQYEAIEGTGSVPQTIVVSLADFEQELDELDDRLEVSEGDVELAERAKERIDILSDVFSSLRTQQRTVIEADINRLMQQLEYLHAIENSVDGSVSTDALDRECSMLEKLVENGRHDRITGSDRLSIDDIEVRLRTKRFEARYTGPPAVSADALLKRSEALLEEIHEFLGGLGEQNESRTAFPTDLQLVKELLTDARDELERDDGDAALESATVAFEGCLMLHYDTARVYATQRVTESLADAVTETTLELDVDVDSCLEAGKSERLLDAIGGALRGEVKEGNTARLRRLLDEHDGSVIRTAAATDFDVQGILEHVSELHANGAVADITVEFDT